MSTELEEYFVKGQDNVISLTLTEAGSTISVTWTELVIVIGPITITRTVEENGVGFQSGVVEITPAGLIEDLSNLTNDTHRVYITVKTAGEPDGVVYGAADSDVIIRFKVSDPV